MRTAFDDAPTIEHQDAVGVDNAGKAVRQNERGAPSHEPIDCALNDRFVLGIDRGQRLVENENRSVAKERPRDRQPLPLSTREPQPALADHRRIALRQRDNELVCVGCARCGDEFIRSGVGLAKPQIVLDRAIEQISILPHDGDFSARRVWIERREIGIANAHGA